MHTTNYVNTLITVSPDTKAVAATAPPTGKASVAELQFVMMHGHDYELTSDDVIFEVFAERKGIAGEDRKAARDQFFSNGQSCLRTSPWPRATAGASTPAQEAESRLCRIEQVRRPDNTTM